MKSVFGSFVKEVFVRILISVLLYGVYYQYITPLEFIYSLVFVYGISLLLIVFYANKVKRIVLHFKIPKQSKAIWTYTIFIILSASIANMLLDIDKYMIKHYMDIDNIAFYSVAIFIAMVISIPSRAMHQITYPITAKLMSEQKWEELNELYKKTSITLQVIGGLLLVGILVNINQLYLLLPKEYSQGLFVVFTIGLSKYFDLMLGNNNAIIFNSKYYKAVLSLGIVLVVLIVLLNMYFIPNYGLNGAAMATLIAITLYSLAKLLFVILRMNLFPFTFKTIVALGVVIITFLVFYYWDFTFHPVINITIKSILVSAFYLGLCHVFKISSDINFVMNSVIKKVLK
jgi:O-antigen/teichoic acid export membrane protein